MLLSRIWHLHLLRGAGWPDLLLLSGFFESPSSAQHRLNMVILGCSGLLRPAQTSSTAGEGVPLRKALRGCREQACASDGLAPSIPTSTLLQFSTLFFAGTIHRERLHCWERCYSHQQPPNYGREQKKQRPQALTALHVRATHVKGLGQVMREAEEGQPLTEKCERQRLPCVWVGMEQLR